MPAYMKSPQKGCTAGELWIKVVLYIVQIFKYMHGLMHRTHRYTNSTHIRLAFQMHAVCLDSPCFLARGHVYA